MNRRSLIAALPAALAAAAPGMAASAPLTPVEALFRDWQALAAEIAAGAGDIDRLAARQCLIAGRIIATPAVDCRDWIMKIAAVSDCGDFGMDGADDPKLWVEARKLLGGGA